MYYCDDLFPSEESTIIQAEKAVIGLQPERNIGLKSFGMSLVPFGQYLQHHFLVKDMRSLQVAKYTEDGKGAELGDIADITQKMVAARPLTLTNKNLILSYKKGLMKKKNLIMAIPLEYAISVREKRLPGKHLEISFEVPNKEGNQMYFDVWLMRLKDRQAWLDKLNRLIAEHSTSDRLPTLK